MNTRTIVRLGLWTLSALTLAMRAQAGAQEEAAAETLFQQARQLVAKGDYQQACRKFAESQRLDPGVGTLLNLAECYAKSGRPASAWATFKTAAGAARKAQQAERVKFAEERATLALARAPRLTVMVSAKARSAGLEIKRDGVTLGEPSWGEAVPLDPGEHRVVAKAPGKQTWSRVVNLPGNGSTTVLTIPALLDQGPGAGKTLGTGGPNTSAPSSSALDDGRHDGRGLSSGRLFAYVAGGVGVAGVAVGTVFGLKAKSKQRDSEQYCLPEDRTACEKPGLDLLSEGRSAATVANVGFAAGAAGLIGGVILYLTAPSPGSVGSPASPRPRALRRAAWMPIISPSFSGLLAEGSF